MEDVIDPARNINEYVTNNMPPLLVIVLRSDLSKSRSSALISQVVTRIALYKI